MIELKVAGVVLSLAGTIVLAIRVTRLLRELAFAVKALDLNVQIRTQAAAGNPLSSLIQMHGMGDNIAREENLGMKLLILGFVLQIVGGALTALSFLV